MVGKDLIMATLFGSGGGSSGSGGGEGEKSLLDAMIDGTATEIRSDTVESIRERAFFQYATLEGVRFPSVKNVGSYAFQNCDAITEITLPNATSIGTYAFSNCDVLRKADFASLTAITGGMFSSCPRLTILILRATDVARLVSSTTNVFGSGTPITSGTGYIYVPRAIVDTYKGATNWSTIADQFRALEDYTVDGTITGELDESKI